MTLWKLLTVTSVSACRIVVCVLNARIVLCQLQQTVPNHFPAPDFSLQLHKRCGVSHTSIKIPGLRSSLSIFGQPGGGALVIQQMTVGLSTIGIRLPLVSSDTILHKAEKTLKIWGFVTMPMQNKHWTKCPDCDTRLARVSTGIRQHYRNAHHKIISEADACKIASPQHRRKTPYAEGLRKNFKEVSSGLPTFIANAAGMGIALGRSLCG